MNAALASSPPAIEPPPRWAALLEHFYARSNSPMIALDRLAGEAVPEPYKALLVHSRDMTPTLEGFYHYRLALRPVDRELQDSAYLREVTLNLAESGQPVEYGVIRIFLDRFPARARRLILEEQQPLGGILRSEAIAHIGWPQTFFAAQSDSRLGAVLRLPRPSRLYGRRNLLLDGHRRILAEVIEVLAPAELNSSIHD
jgi:chorismate-pyruvate lyase